MDSIEKLISPFVESQFPSFYKEEGENFIAFVKAYYEWMESNNQALFYSRRILDYRDIDTTLNDFLVYFKEKYLKNIPFVTETNQRFLAKRILDLYRSKGTERSIDLLFRLLFQVKPTVYYPSDDVMKLSDDKWIIPRYLELSPSQKVYEFINREVLGTTSGAKAFIERVSRKRINGKFIDVAYISNIRGRFSYGEKIVLSANPNIAGAPSVLGSMTTLSILYGGLDFAIGDIFNVITSSGLGGKARVTDVTTDTGKVSYEIVDGGFGYTLTSNVFVSDKVLVVSGRTNANASITDFELFETVTQPLYTLVYSSASNADAFAAGVTVENYHGNGDVAGSGLILNNETSSTTAGTLIIKPVSGDLSIDASFAVQGNTDTGLIDSYTNSTAVGQVVGINATSIGVHGITNTFRDYAGNKIIGSTSNTYGDVIAISTGAGADFEIGSLAYQQDVFLFTDRLNANNTGNVAFMSILLDGSNSNVAANGYGFPKLPSGDLNTPIQSMLNQTSLTIGTIASLDNVNPGDNYNVKPFVTIREQTIADYELHDLSFGISNTSGLFVDGELIEESVSQTATLLTVENFTGTYANTASATTFEVGEYVYQSNGSANVATGFVYQSSITAGDGNVKLIGVTGTFVNTYTVNGLSSNSSADVLTVANSSTAAVARAIVRSSNSSILNLKRISFENTFTQGGNIVGLTSGSTATIDGIGEITNTAVLGLNANVATDVLVGNSVVTAVDVVDSGFGYVDGETANLVNANTNVIVTARVNLINDGTGEGYYQTSAGLSGNKKLHDNYYYQDYSYEVQSVLALEKYSDVLLKVIHVAGTKLFGKVVTDRITNTEITTIAANNISTLNLNAGTGKFSINEFVYQSNGSANVATGNVSNTVLSIVTTEGYQVLFEANTLVSYPTYSSNTASGTISRIVANSSSNTLTLYITGVTGAFETANTVESITGKSLAIANVANGNTVTGSFAVGETVYQSNGTANIVTGTVSAANSTLVEVINANGTFSLVYSMVGATSNATANVSTISNVTNTVVVSDAINIVTVSNTTGHFVAGGNLVGNTSSATANITYVSLSRS